VPKKRTKPITRGKNQYQPKPKQGATKGKGGNRRNPRTTPG